MDYDLKFQRIKLERKICLYARGIYEVYDFKSHWTSPVEARALLIFAHKNILYHTVSENNSIFWWNSCIRNGWEHITNNFNPSSFVFEYEGDSPEDKIKSIQQFEEKSQGKLF